MTLRLLMILANMLIAFDYFAIAIYWTQHLRMPLHLRRRNKEASLGSIVVVMAAVVFFVGCAHTHVDITLAMLSGEEIWPHWLDWYNVVSHLLQGIGGAVFAAGATYWIHVRIFDRKQYESTVERARKSSYRILEEGEEARQRLALMEEVVRLRHTDLPAEPGKDRRRDHRKDQEIE